MFDLPKYGDGICLARLSALLDALGIDRGELQRRSIVITGSNGKGSTAAFAASIGRAAGLKTGLFTSPHLIRFNERFKIDGDDIDDATLAALMLRVSVAIAAMPRERFGAFEAQFALACLCFQRAGCELMIFEAGIGGRFDPVRLVGASLTCVTSIDYEHVDLLGSTLEAIVSDKSDACAAGGTIVFGENCRDLAAHLRAYNRARAVTSLFVGEHVVIENAAVDGGFDLQFGTIRFDALGVALPGRFQVNNAAIATTLALMWMEREHPEMSMDAIEAAIRHGLRETRWPGRLEIISPEPLIVIDVGHTPDGVMQALNGLFATHGPDDWILVLGTSRDKDVAAIASRLAPSFAEIIGTSAHHKGADAEVVAVAARAANPNAVLRVLPEVADAVRVSRALALETNRRIYVAGGLFVAVEYAHIVRGGDAGELKFF